MFSNFVHAPGLKTVLQVSVAAAQAHSEVTESVEEGRPQHHSRTRKVVLDSQNAVGPTALRDKSPVLIQ